MKADDIGDVEERLEGAYTLYPDRDLGSGRNIGVEADDAESEGLGAKGGRGADPTEADDAESSPARPADERRQRAVETPDWVRREMLW